MFPPSLKSGEIYSRFEANFELEDFLCSKNARQSQVHAESQVHVTRRQCACVFSCCHDSATMRMRTLSNLWVLSSRWASFVQFPAKLQATSEDTYYRHTNFSILVLFWADFTTSYEKEKIRNYSEWKLNKKEEESAISAALWALLVLCFAFAQPIPRT